MKLLVNILFICLGCQLINAKTMDDTSKIEAIENKYIIIRRGKKKYYLGIYS